MLPVQLIPQSRLSLRCAAKGMQAGLLDGDSPLGTRRCRCSPLTLPRPLSLHRPKPTFLFGRVPVCDFILEHASISRQHAFVGWDHTGQLLITDMSAHGTTINRTTKVATGGVSSQTICLCL